LCFSDHTGKGVESLRKKQKSIFEATARGKVFEQMRRRVESVIVPEEDGVKYFPLCEKCAGTVEIIGQGVFTDPDQEFAIY